MATEDRREPIFELAEKFQFLKENQISRAYCGHAVSESSFCEKLGVPRMTLMGSVKAGGLTSAQQQALAYKCKFSLAWPEWSDPKAERNTKREDRRDTYEAFKARYLEHHSEEGARSSSLSRTPSDKLSSFRLVGAPKADIFISYCKQLSLIHI